MHFYTYHMCVLCSFILAPSCNIYDGIGLFVQNAAAHGSITRSAVHFISLLKNHLLHIFSSVGWKSRLHIMWNMVEPILNGEKEIYLQNKSKSLHTFCFTRTVGRKKKPNYHSSCKAHSRNLYAWRFCVCGKFGFPFSRLPCAGDNSDRFFLMAANKPWVFLLN